MADRKDLIGRLDFEPVRTAFRNEAGDFTTWLEQHLDVLAERLEIELNIVQREKNVGDFHVDLLCEDGSGRAVIVENQLEKTDHDHLGKLLTYLVNLDANIAIWVTGEPRLEHQKVIDWLNESTPADLSFYLVQVEAVRIGQSPLAPLFTVLAGPNVQTKEVGEKKKEWAERHFKRVEFWKGLLEKSKDKTKLMANISPGRASWISTGAGKSGVVFSYVILRDWAAAEMYIDHDKETGDRNKAIFDALNEPTILHLGLCPTPRHAPVRLTDAPRTGPGVWRPARAGPPFRHSELVEATPAPLHSAGMTTVVSHSNNLSLKPTHKAVTTYYHALDQFRNLGVTHETAVRSAFQELLEHCARQFDWKLVPEYPIKRKGKADAKADGALLDNFGLNHGLWEAKDSADDLDKEIKIKFAVGYPKQNILFWQPDRAVLYRNSERFYEADLTKAADLVHILSLFLEFAPPAIAEWEKAVEEFRDKVPQIGASLKVLIEKERQTNKKFIAAFDGFYSLCRSSLNPNISIEAVEEMIIQHILTERIFRKIFAVADFIQRNVIAHEIETVITALNSRSFSRDDFSKSLEHFYGAIENAAATITDFHEKQTFLNTVYERFFQGFCVKVADTHGIVYTPQPLVNFMVASVEHILGAAFKTSLAHKNVHILDPFTGTGNYIVNIMRHIPKTALLHKFAQELHCNEIMLLPYYVASMNIEHAYYEATGEYESFEGICLVDTFQTAEKQQGELGFFNEKNSARVERQKKTPVRVVIANPPYNAGQINENDNNKNRKYPEIDRRVRVTYGETSKATLLRKLSDPYVKAIRYATDRIGDSGIVCFVNNNSFVTEKTFDGMRKELAKDFDLIYVLDLGGNVRKNPKLSGTTHNVFGIQVGVSINSFIRLPKERDTTRQAKVYYHAVGVDWHKEKKYQFLDETRSTAGVKWKRLTPDKKGYWITNDTDEEFESFIPVGSKEAKAKGGTGFAIFKTYSNGVSTNRDAVVYDFDADRLAKRVEQFAEDYNAELRRWKEKGCPKNVDDFVNYDKVKWSRNLKRWFRQEDELRFKKTDVRESAYRPFTRLKLHYARMFVDEVGTSHEMFPTSISEEENLVILCPGSGGRSPFWCFSTNYIPNLNFVSIDSAQCLPLYTYAESGKERCDNIISTSLTLFQAFYDDVRITRADIFHYIYALLHHPVYRDRYAANLKRELPRIPLVGVVLSKERSAPASFFSLAAVNAMRSEAKPNYNPKASAQFFHAFADAGKKLAALHVNYESVQEFPLKRQENKEVHLDWRVEAMKLNKDKGTLFYNDFLTLSGIPPEVHEYRLGNRSALEWVVDQYRVTRDENGDIARDPNRLDDEQYIVRLVGKVIRVSVETIKIINNLPVL